MERWFTELFWGKSQPLPSVQPISEPAFNESDVEVVRLSAESIVRVVNDSMRIANDSKNIETRRSRVRVAHEKIEQLQEIASQFSFLNIQRLDDVERDLVKIDRETDAMESPPERPGRSQGANISIDKDADEWLRDLHARLAESLGRELVERFNRSMKLASEVKLVSSRRANLHFARQTLDRLKTHAAEHPFIKLQQLEAVERDLTKIEAETLRLEEAAAALGPAHNPTFLKLPLAQQCEALGIPLETLHLPRVDGRWVVGAETYKRPEDALMAHFRGQGFAGTACEGAAVLMLMKSACLDFLESVALIGGRDGACSAYFEAQCLVNRDRSVEIIAAVHAAGELLLSANLREIMTTANYAALYPAMDEHDLIAIWRSLSAGRLADYTKFICQDFSYRAGWPDLTVTDGQQVRFIEVKTTDKLHASQQDVIRDILLPTGSDVRVVQIKAKRAS